MPGFPNQKLGWKLPSKWLICHTHIPQFPLPLSLWSSRLFKAMTLSQPFIQRWVMANAAVNQWGGDAPPQQHTLCLRARRHATHVYTEQVHEWVSGCEKGKDERKKTRKKKSNRLSGTMMSRQSQPHLPDLLYARAILVHWDNKQNMVHINKISQVREDHLALSNVFMF